MRRSFRFLIPAVLAWFAGACSDAPLIAPVDAPARSAAAAGGVDVRDRWIVVFNDRVNDPAQEARGLVQAHGGTLHFTYQHAIRGFAATLNPQAVEGLRRNPGVKYVVPDDIVTLAGTTQGSAPWGLDRTDQRNRPLSGTYTYESGASGQGVNVYVVDGGIRYSHAEFGGRAVFGADFVGDGRGGADCYGHGTHVAGIIGGATYGVAKAARLYSVRVVSCTNVTTTSNVVAGLDWVRYNHVKPAVVNMSMTTPDNLAQDDAVKALLAAGVVVVSSAGNVTFTQPGNVRQEDVCNVSSAYIAGVITVGATDQNDTRWSNSNIGYCMDVFAPGVSITSADYLSDTGAVPLSGTSMAAAHAAGAVARYLQTTPSATPAQAHAWIVDNATAGVVVNPGHLSPNRLLFVDPALGAPPVTPLSVDAIYAYSPVQPYASNEHWVSVSGGVAPYTYTWVVDGYYQPDYGGYMYYTNQGYSYYVELTVTDAVGQQVSTSTNVEVSSSSCGYQEPYPYKTFPTYEQPRELCPYVY